MTWPACASLRINRVDATFRPRRKRVATSSRLGKTEKSSGFFTNIAVSRISSAKAMFDTMSTSSSGAGIGTINSRMIPTTPRGTAPFDSTAPIMISALSWCCDTESVRHGSRPHRSRPTRAAGGIVCVPAREPLLFSCWTNASTCATAV